MSSWISIHKQLPDESAPVLVTDGNEVIMAKFCKHCNIFDSGYKHFTIEECLYWMPLPSPLELPK